MTAAEGVGRRCTIAVGQVATVVDLQSLQALRAFRSIDTAVNSRKQEETEAPSSSVKSPSQTEGVVTSPALFGLFDTVTLEISNVQLNVASARSQSEDKPPLVIAPTFALAKISLSVKCTPSQSASRDSLPSASGRSDQEAIVTTVTWRVTSASARLLCLSGGTPVDLGTPLLHLDDVSGSIEREEWRDGALEAHSRKVRAVARQPFQPALNIQLSETQKDDPFGLLCFGNVRSVLACTIVTTFLDISVLISRCEIADPDSETSA